MSVIAGDVFSKEQHELTFTPRYSDFDIHRIKPIMNQFREETVPERLRFVNKPFGGLWLSIDGGWESWCSYEEPDWLGDNQYAVTLTPDSKVLYIDSVDQLHDIALRCEPLAGMYMSRDTPYEFSPDFEALSQDYDAMFVFISGGSDLYNALYGWDCSSGVLFHADAIDTVEDLVNHTIVYSKEKALESAKAAPDDVYSGLLETTHDVSSDITDSYSLL